MGYGDIYPVTVIGRIIAILIAFLGVCAVAVPTGIISAGFVEKFSKNENSDKKFHDIHEVGEILCDRESGFCGLNTNEIMIKFGIRIYMIIRGELTIVPNDRLTVNEGDILIVNSEKIVKKGGKKTNGKKK